MEVLASSPHNEIVSDYSVVHFNIQAKSNAQITSYIRSPKKLDIQDD